MRRWQQKLLLLARHKRLLALLGLLLLLATTGAYYFGNYYRAIYHLEQARRAWSRQEIDQAEAHLRQHLALDPASGEGHLLLARLARRSGGLEEAAAHLQAARQYGARADDIHLEKILTELQEGNFSGGHAAFVRQSLAQGHPDSFLIYEALSQGYSKTYQLAEALECLNHMLETQPENTYALLRRGWVREQLRDFAGAETDYRSALSMQPHSPLGRQRLGHILATYMSKPEEAVLLYEALHQEQPGNGEVAVGLAHCWIELGRRSEARSLLDTTLAESPRNVEALTERGKLTLETGELAQAEADLQEAVALQPYSKVAGYLLVQCLSRRGKKAEARRRSQWLDRVESDQRRLDELIREVSRKPEDADLRYQVGKLFLRFGEDQEGERWLTTALHADPAHQPARQALADHFQRRGRLDLAGQHRQPDPLDAIAGQTPSRAP